MFIITLAFYIGTGIATEHISKFVVTAIIYLFQIILYYINKFFFSRYEIFMFDGKDKPMFQIRNSAYCSRGKFTIKDMSGNKVG